MSWLEPLPRDAWELRLQRLALAVLIVLRLPNLPRDVSQPFPAGIARWIDFTFLADSRIDVCVSTLFAGALALYVLGRALPLATGILMAVWVAYGALANSQGGIGHHTQLLGLVLLAQCLAHLRAALARLPAARRAAAAQALAVDYTVQVIVACYVLAGLMKVVLSRGLWFVQIPFIASDIAKTHSQVYASTGELALLGRADWLATFALSHPMLMRLLVGPSLLLELCTPLALLGRRSALLIGLGLIAMHRGIDFLMLIQFRENEALVWIYLVNLPWLLVCGARALRGRLAVRTPRPLPGAEA